MKCPFNDSYGTDAGNRKLTYPVGLLSLDEVNLAGATWSNSDSNSNYYLYTNRDYWLLSPSFWLRSVDAGVLYVNSVGNVGNYVVPSMYGVRPALTIAPSAPLLSGDGSQNNPYVI